MNQGRPQAKTNKKTYSTPLITLYIGGLDKEVTEEQLCSHFTKYRSFRFLKIPRDPETQRARGYAFVNFTDPEEAEKAKNTSQVQKIGRNPVKISYKTNENLSLQTDGFIPKKNENQAVKAVSSSENFTRQPKAKDVEVVKPTVKISTDQTEAIDKELQDKVLNFLVVNLAKFIQLDQQKQKNILGELLYPKVYAEVGSRYTSRITGMLIDFDVLSVQEIVNLIADRTSLLERIQEAKNLIDQDALQVPINSSA